MLPTNLRPIEYAKSIQRKMAETWFYQKITRTPTVTGTVRTNISTAMTPPLVKPENTYTTVTSGDFVVGGTYQILTMGNISAAQYVTAGATAPAITALTISASYIVTALGSTTTAQWTTAGVEGTAIVGTIFTAAAQGVGTGTVLLRQFTAATIGTDGTGTTALYEPANPVFSQQELTLATYQSSIIVSNELFDDTANLMEFALGILADALVEQISNTTLLAVRDGVSASRLTDGADYLPFASQLARLGLTLSSTDTPAFVWEQGRKVCYVMHPSIFRNFVELESLGGSQPVTVAGVPFRAGTDGSPDMIWGKSVYLSNAMLANNSDTLAGVTGAHILLVDLSQVILYEMPLMVTIDRQTLLGNNQSVIYATHRAVGSLMNDLAVVSMNLKPT